MTLTLHSHLDQRLDLLASLRDLAAQQNEAIVARRTDDLLRLLAQRERLAEALLADAEAFDASAKEWKTSGRSSDSEVAVKLAKAESLLEEILAFDAADEAAIRESCGRITHEIQDLSASTAARQAYRGNSSVQVQDPVNNRFTDSTG